MEEGNRFWVHDASICVGSKTAPYDMFTRGREGDWESYNAVREVLKGNGYTFHQDPQIRKHYPSLSQTHHAGSKDDVHFVSEIYPAGFKFEFYEDVVRDNSNGGRYHFDKLLKMPYLRRQKVLLIRRKILARLSRLGFSDQTDPVGLSPFNQILALRKKDLDFRGYPIAPLGQPSCNVNDADGVPLKDGDVRCFLSLNGRLQRGTVYYNMNSVWWVVIGSDRLENRSAHDLFTYNAVKHGRKFSFEPPVNMAKALKRAIERQEFERAAAIRDALKRLVDSFEFKLGDSVLVDNPRYHGPGIVEFLRPPLYVGVRLPNGNTWQYEWPTVRPAAAAVNGPAHASVER